MFNISPKLRGTLYLAISAASLSVTFIASKQALAELTILGFAPLWFAIASLWGIGYYALQPHKISPTNLKSRWQPLLWLGLSSGIANYFFFTAVSLGDPTVVAFFSRATTLFALLMGVVLLGERLTRSQWGGAVVALTGAGLMTYQGGKLIATVLALTLAASFFHALTSYIAKSNIKTIPPLILGIARTVVITIFLSILSFLAGELVAPSLAALGWIIGGSFFGPFLSYYLFYQGLKTLHISQATIIRATQPLFVAIYSFVLFGEVIGERQFFGGIIILLGVGLILAPNVHLSLLSLANRLEKGILAWKEVDAAQSIKLRR